MDWTPEQIEAVGKIVAGVVGAVLVAVTTISNAILSRRQKCDKAELQNEIDIAHALRRSEVSGRPWEQEMRSRPRKPKQRRKADASSAQRDPDAPGQGDHQPSGDAAAGRDGRDDEV